MKTIRPTTNEDIQIIKEHSAQFTKTILKLMELSRSDMSIEDMLKSEDISKDFNEIKQQGLELQFMQFVKIAMEV